VAEHRLGIDQAVPCGLILNELTSNALKHAFPAQPRQARGFVHVAGRRRYELRVADSGIGLPEALDIENSRSLGLQLVRSLTAQLSGVLTVIAAGDGVPIVFPAAQAT